jgi:hypothetical protein
MRGTGCGGCGDRFTRGVEDQKGAESLVVGISEHMELLKVIIKNFTSISQKVHFQTHKYKLPHNKIHEGCGVRRN